MAKVSFRALLVVACVGGANADGFLSVKGDQDISTDDVQETLQSLLLSTTSFELKSIEDSLRPMFVALPKNQHGALEHATVRYALNRYFVHLHGWNMNGLDLQTDGRNSAFAPTLIKDRAPSFIQDMLEQRLQGEGLGLHDLAVFAATMSNLVHQEALGKLQTIFDAMGFPTEGEIPGAQRDIAVKNFVIRGIVGLGKKLDISKDLTKYKLHAQYPDWDNLHLWIADFARTHDYMAVRNPFFQQSHSFETSASLVDAISRNYGKYQNLECMSLKGRLVDMDQQGTGRVLLRDFYAGLEDPSNQFAESVDYLRNLGVLDERDPQRLSVMIPNYIMSKTNCLANSGFYASCCSNECEGLLRHVEESLASASASPGRIADVISALPSDTVDAPRNLSSTLRGRLEEIAQHNGGEVPLHGRLFSQWMHHAYPRECPFPHVSGTKNPLSQVQWREHSGQASILATREDVDVYMDMEHEETLIEELSWTAIEELVADVKPPCASWMPAAVRCIIALAALASIGSSLVQAMKTVGQSSEKVEKFMV